jgi:hypothetical protein
LWLRPRGQDRDCFHFEQIRRIGEARYLQQGGRWQCSLVWEIGRPHLAENIGVRLDVGKVYADAAFTVIDPELLRFLPARILVDERGFAKTLIERVDALDQKGPPLLPEGEDEMVRVWYAKMLVRIARGDLEANYRRVELLFQALENYFKLRGLWYRGPKAGLPWLARHDPETHTAFARALEPQASLEDLRALVQRVLPAQ